ncbi:MAG: flavodoxin family protein [Phycisphaeraceae bacterium]|nr:flavodoxin family protein [Phycisphaeraceae bacterium]
MKVLGLMGSARRDGNTNDLVDVVLAAAAEQGAQTEKIVLADYRVEHIENCQVCKQRGACVHADDDFDKLMAKVYGCDVFIFGSPVYWYTVSGRLKVFLDRWSCELYKSNDEFCRKMKPKAGGIVTVQEESTYERAASCIEALEKTVKYAPGATYLGYVLGPGGKRGTVLKHEATVAAARELGRKAAAFRPAS